MSSYQPEYYLSLLVNSPTVRDIIVQNHLIDITINDGAAAMGSVNIGTYIVNAQLVVKNSWGTLICLGHLALTLTYLL